MNRLNDATSCCDTVSSMKDLYCSSLTPWHLAQGLLQRGSFQSVCLMDHKTYHIVPMIISMTKATGARAITIFVTQYLAQCWVLSRCSLNIYQRNEYGISNMWYLLTVVATMSFHLVRCHLYRQYQGQSSKSGSENIPKSNFKERNASLEQKGNLEKPDRNQTKYQEALRLHWTEVRNQRLLSQVCRW